MTLSNQTAIVGIGETEYGKVPGRTPLSFEAEAARKALEDAGLRKEDVDTLICRNSTTKPLFDYCTVLAQKLGMQPNIAMDVGSMGATPVTMAMVAAALIHSGVSKTVLCTYGRSNASNEGPPRGSTGGDAADYSAPFGHAGAPAGFAMAARRHMHEFGTTSEQFGWVAVAARHHASLNPASQMRQPITIEDHQNSRWIAEPFHLLDCCLVSDGGGAFVVTSAERARDLRHAPVYIAGVGGYFPFGDLSQAPSMTTNLASPSARMAYAMAGVEPKDIDFAELYDCFTYTTLVQLEEYGFCGKGEGGAFVEGGKNIMLGGVIPVNTHGGLLSNAHIECMLHITEAVKQLRRDPVLAEQGRQVENARVGLVSGNGGILQTHNSLILRN